ncbi:hypothetical protein PGTUg99_007254 [Puccinia graminis f. sp. tritici]|uniref:DNA helicase n=1 Tax=Puccinia graminis f. sp. tritici TaxID=56615 RepID=A0A5B0SBY5_PUCGR|nr:hypothetical protein PGTUg99_007254 [Puccinia graminis f. sp. tritici]
MSSSKLTSSKLKPSIYFNKPASASKGTVIVPATYLPESYRQEIRSNKTVEKTNNGTTKKPAIDISPTSSLSPSAHPPNSKKTIQESEDSDAEGSIEVLDQDELSALEPINTHHQKPNSNSSSSSAQPRQQKSKAILVPSSSSPPPPLPSRSSSSSPSSSQGSSLVNDPLAFTVSPQVYLKSQALSKDKGKKKTRRIAPDSSEEEEQEQPQPTTSKDRRTRRRIDSDDSDEPVTILAPSKGNKKLANKRPRLASSSTSGSDSDPDCSIAIISAPQTRPTTKKLRRRIASDEEQEADENLDAEQDEWKRGSDEDDDDENHHQRVSEDDAIRFFNSCDVVDLPAVTACTLEQAKMIVGCRPFKDAEDMKSKLRKKKGVNAGILKNYQDMMKGYFEVDRVLSKCEKHGQDLSSIMNIWARGVQLASETTGGEGSKKEEEEGATDLVNHLTDAQGLTTEEERKAFADYIYTQPPTVPKKITLKSYQMLGINWMNLLYSKGLSCILADEMGLGKTAQVVCFLSQLKLAGQPGPHLVVVPSSTLENWKREFGNFSSNLVVREYYGSQMERMELRYELKAMPGLDVVITTYNIATGTVEDRKFLDRMRFDACVYDEGHQLKNSQSKRYKDLMRMHVRWRLLLTGTPLQNNLQELVSLLSFILPKIFGGQAQEDLRLIFKVPSEAQVNLLAQTRITRAKKMMSPFVLRRKKTQVLKELPKKIEKVIYCDLEPNQSEAYNQLIKKSKKYLMNSAGVEDDEELEEEEEEEVESFKKNGLLGGTAGKKSPTKKTIANSTTNVLMELRKVSNHPLLFRRQFDGPMLRKIAQGCLNEVEFFDCSVELIIEDLEVMSDFEIDSFCAQYKSLRRFQLSRDEFFNSGKVKTLQLILASNNNLHPDPSSSSSSSKEIDKSKIVKQDSPSRFLIFSQFTQMLDILKVVLKLLDVKFLVLTGQTNVTERQSLVDQFTNDPSITVFLLSTRAGGLGLNLMAADTVILFDQDFNPHNDRQAEDRAYRLGQTRDVKVFKLISKGTIEEDILQLASTKIEIDNSISNPTPTVTAETATATTTTNTTTTTATRTTDKDTATGVEINERSLPSADPVNHPPPLSENLVKKSLINRFRNRVLSSNVDP